MLLTSGESDLRGSERGAQPLARAVQAEPHDGATRAQRDGELFPAQALPGHEREQLAVGLAEGGEGAGERARLLGREGRLECASVDVLDEPFAEGAAPALAPALVRDDAPGHAEQPGPQLVALRAAVEAAPQRGEGLGDHLCGVFRLADAAQRVTADRRV